jgi:ABC-type microcin C transport system duplicated ATPase subunit YejF
VVLCYRKLQVLDIHSFIASDTGVAILYITYDLAIPKFAGNSHIIANGKKKLTNHLHQNHAKANAGMKGKRKWTDIQKGLCWLL